ncbi:hypothetical protein B0H65DRAFT_57802 [Neurospora tetraspora]|uniref:HCNGP-domain-containing protein n=1 Tax=Neurospora tetraspora TaxID=94610 RepID=A0AAE0JQ74_9PEZI|nr:hypothetical protein B0H65DRAFT_57802 [Neurospora tetraspora]
MRMSKLTPRLCHKTPRMTLFHINHKTTPVRPLTLKSNFRAMSPTTMRCPSAVANPSTVTTSSSTITNGHNESTLSQPSAPQPPEPSNQPPPPPQQQPQPAPSPSTPLGPVLGPALGPSMPPPTGAASSNTLLPDPDSDVDMSFLDDPSTSSTALPSAPSAEPPKSPYTTTRTLLRDLTLPALPNMDIPASPPLSPSDISSVERLASLTSKFDKFLELKRTKGQHFNSRIAQSAATKNPGLMDKLMRFVGVETEFWFDDDDDIAAQNDISLDKGAEVAAPAPPAGAEQYATTLSKEVWDPSAMPGWAYRDRLRKTQERMQRESERKRGERVEFVSGGSTTAMTGSGMASRTGSATPLGSVAYPGGMSGGTGTGTGTPSAGAGAGTTAGVKRKSRFDT